MPYLEYKPPADDNPTVLELQYVESMSVDPVMSLDDMNVSHLRHTLRVRCLFTAATAATFFQELRDITKSLTTPRGRLIIALDSTKTTVLYDIDQNQTSGTGLRPDIEGGPKPRSLEVQEFITGIAAHITWTIEWNVIPCDTAADSLPNVLSRHHSVTFAYSDDGRLTRTVEGELRIPDRAKTTEYDKNVQNAQGLAYFHVPRGWRRLSANMGISPNGLVLQFQYIDEELEIGWHDLAQSMDLEWSERGGWFPPLLDYNFTFRVRGRRGIAKQTLLTSVIIPMVNDRISRLPKAGLLPGESEFKEDLLTNEISGSIHLPGVPMATSTTASAQYYLPPSKQFGRTAKGLRRINPNAVQINGKTTNFETALFANESHRKRWETLPLVTRLLIRDVCDRSRLDPTGYADEETDADLLIELFEEEQRPETEAEGGESGSDRDSPILKRNPFESGTYIEDSEVIQISIDYHTRTLGNQNILNVDDSGALETNNDKSQRIYQDRVPTMVVKTVGRAIRIGKQALPRVEPVVFRPASDSTIGVGGSGQGDEVKLVPQKVKITNFGPHMAPGGQLATYGVMWSYIHTRELDGKFFGIDPQTALTQFNVPERPTRQSAIFKEGVMAGLQWNDEQ